MNSRQFAILSAAFLAAFLTFGASSSLAGQKKLAVEILDGKAKPPLDLAAGDILIREGEAESVAAGEIVRLADLAPGRRAKILVYFDQALSSPGTIRRGADALQSLARELTELGEVEILTAAAEGRPERLVRSADPLVLSERLSRMALTERGEQRPLAIRAATLQALTQLNTGGLPIPIEERLSRVRSGLAEEVELVANRLDALALAVLEAKAATELPLVVLAVFDGFDLEPLGFYGKFLDPQLLSKLSEEDLPNLGERPARLGEAFALAGVTFLPLAISRSPEEDKAAELAEVVSADPQGGSVTAVPGVKVSPGKIFGRKKNQPDEDAEVPIELVAPLSALELLAKVGGGEVLVSETAARDTVRRFAERFLVTFASSSVPGQVLDLVVRVTRPGHQVRAAERVGSGLPSVLADLRLAEVAQGFEESGLPMVAVLRPAHDDEVELETRVDLHELIESAEATPRLRISVSAQSSDGLKEILREVAPAGSASASDWVFRRALTLPAGAREVVVLVEDLGSGLWGGRRANLVTGELAEGDSELLAPARALEILRQKEAVLRGRVKFEVQTFAPNIARVLYLINEKASAEAKAPPFAARVDLGRTPRRQTLTVIAYDSAGLELGRDSAVLNGGQGGFAVDIVSPKDSKGVGSVEVEAAITVPLEHRLDRALFFWNNELVATLFAPPFKQRLNVPAAQPIGYVRVVGMLDDGSLAEDVLFLNGPPGEELDVRLVELFVVVTDKNGRPMRGLQQADFSVSEEGEKQEIATFGSAEDVPLTLGLAIDSSASMFVKLPSVQRAANDFLRRTFQGEDRAFVVDFDSQPRLARATTTDLERLTQAVDSLEASGRTALWESIVFSLIQLQGVQGRKALIVFSDGADEDDQFPFRSSVRIARELGVPIYLILMRKKPEETAISGLVTRSFSSRAVRLSESTGGRVFYAKEYKNLDAIYAEIEEELRSQYLITYYPKDKGEKGWRDIEVDLAVPGLKPRTLAGYWE